MRPGNGYYKEFQFEVSANTVESVMKIPLGLNLISTLNNNNKCDFI